MYKSLVALAIVSVASAPVLAQTATPTTTPAKPETVKKRVCYQEEADSYSRLGGRKVCKTVEVPAQPSNGQNNSRTPAAPEGSSERG